MNIFEGLAQKVEALRPHAHKILNTADFYACTMIGQLDDILDAMYEDRDATTQRIFTFTLAAATPQPLDIPLGPDYALQLVTVDSAAVCNVRIKAGGRVVWGDTFNSAAGQTVQSKVVEGAFLLDSGVDYSIEGDSVGALTLVVTYRRPRPKRLSKVGNKLPQGLPATTPAREPERGLVDESVRPPAVNPENVHVPLENGEVIGGERLIPYPPYDG